MNETVPFAKMNGIGNQIVVADMRGRAEKITSTAAIALANDPKTHFDQLMAVHDAGSIGADAVIEIYNADGSAAEACGNGTRCVVKWLAAQTGGEEFSFEVMGKPLAARLQKDGRISVNMGVPRFDWTQIPLSEEFSDTRGIELEVGPVGAPILHTPSVANIGNPHCVFWATNDVYSYGLDKFGPMLEHHMLFPDRANISVAQVVGQNEITMRTWERGVGITQACGSAACAAAVCAVRLEKTGRNVTINQPGGSLQISWREDNFIIMTGTAEHEFYGKLDPASGAWVST